ncbi:T9SS type A sorting domain-containing protein [Fibrella sp. ES10-3-2-2]|nr:hypothetical protein A6C57_25420 [Fibrella sp. ES10-3-2-2]
MKSFIRSFSVAFLLLTTYLHGLAQATISTQPLPSPSVCPGTLLDVPFTSTGTFTAGNTFSIRFTKGSESFTLLTTGLLGNPTIGQYTASVKLPSPLAAGTYQIRVVSSSPATVGSISPSALVVKTQPTSAPLLAAQSIGNYTSRFTSCQNDTPFSLSSIVGEVPDNYRVLYDIGTGLASTHQKTFAAPFLSTTKAGLTTYNLRYVVIDSTKGCNPTEQPGTVSYLERDVKTQPDAPATPVSSLTYCQSQPALPLVAAVTNAGSDLLWYDASGNQLTNQSPMPATSQAGTATYQVSQVLAQCEGPKAVVSVTVRAASPAPMSTKTRIELCRGAATEPLSATGTNLIWTDPMGTTSTVAPTPTTLNASKLADGDVYYVSQTSSNGCPSERLAITVLVQAQPTLSLSGGKNINLGSELPLQLSFTGKGPYTYKIVTSPGTTTLGGSATKDTTLLLLPERSATYQIAEVSNKCGVGLPGSPATATVVVVTPTIRTMPLQTAAACAGNTLTASFQTTGTFNAGSTFRLQIARTNPDTTKLSYTDLTIVQQVGTAQLTGVLPATATSGTFLVRVIATNPKIPILGTPSTTTLTVIGQASATLSTSTPAILDGQTARLAVSFTGEGPWTFTYRDSTDVSGSPKTITTTTNPYSLTLTPKRTTAYRLMSVSNDCSLNTNIPGRVVVTVSPLLAVESLLSSQINVYPVPATNSITVHIDPTLLARGATLTLHNQTGRTVLTQTTRQPATELWLADQPAGAYVLQISVDGQTISRRLIRQ